MTSLMQKDTPEYLAAHIVNSSSNLVLRPRDPVRSKSFSVDADVLITQEFGDQ